MITLDKKKVCHHYYEPLFKIPALGTVLGFGFSNNDCWCYEDISLDASISGSLLIFLLPCGLRFLGYLAALLFLLLSLLPAKEIILEKRGKKIKTHKQPHHATLLISPFSHYIKLQMMTPVDIMQYSPTASPNKWTRSQHSGPQWGWGRGGSPALHYSSSWHGGSRTQAVSSQEAH